MLREGGVVGWAVLLKQYSGTSTPENFEFLLPSVCDSQDFPGGLCFASKKMEIEQGGLYIETLLWTRLERNLAFHWLGLSYMKTPNCKGNWEM